MKTNEPLVYTTLELAAALQISRNTIFCQVRDGKFPIPSIKIGSRVLFDRAAVDAWLRGEKLQKKKGRQRAED